MNFNFTSQICTTKEQSERLLALGLNPDTADMGLVGDIPIILNTIWKNADPIFETPAWSLHRLMTLLMIGDKLGCITHNIHQNNISTYYELVIASIEHLIKIDEFNKEYLGE